MTLAQVQGSVAFYLFLIATWASLILAAALMWPKQANRAEIELTETPLRSLFTGLGMLVPTLIGIVLIRLPGGGAKLAGFAALVCIGAALTIGSAGIALLMGRRMGEMSDTRGGFAGLVRGSMIYSLALGFPLIGWFVFLPASFMLALGAGVRSVWRSSAAAMPPITPKSPEYDVMEPRRAI